MHNDIGDGWSKEMRDILGSFRVHRDLLLFMKHLGLINSFTLGCCQRDFEQHLWSKIRDGDDFEQPKYHNFKR